VTALGLVLLTLAKPHGSYATQVLPGLVLVGLGAGLALMPAFATAASGVAPYRAGAASSTVAATLPLGAGIGAAPFVGPHHSSVVNRYTTTLWCACGGVLLAALAAGLMITVRPDSSDARSVVAMPGGGEAAS
jgi:hypothetical protein